VLLTADAENAPYLSIATHDMAAPPVWTHRARLGNIEDMVPGGGYGLWTDNGWFTGVVTSSVIRSAISGARIEMNTERIFGIDDGGNVQWYAETANGKLYAGQGAVVLDYDGISVDVSSDDDTKLSFTSDGNRIAHIGGYIGPRFTGDTQDAAKLSINANAVGSADLALLALRANGSADEYAARIDVQSGYYGSPSEISLVADETTIWGDLNVLRNNASYTGYVFVPLQALIRHPSYTNVGVNTGTYTLTLDDKNWGLPAGVKAVSARLSVRWTSASNTYYALVRPKGTSQIPLICRALVANMHTDVSGVVPCDSNGDLELVIGGANADNVYLDITGYWI